MSSVKTKLDELEERAARLPVAPSSASNCRADRLTDEELLRIEHLCKHCQRGDRYDLSILTVPELRELKHLRILSSPQLSDADVLRARELKDGPEYDALAKKAGLSTGGGPRVLSPS